MAAFGRAIVGGPLLLVADSSRQAAAVAIRILGGEKPSEIRTPPVRFPSPMFDWREMQRWGIRESRLPPGSKILFRSPTVWEQYQWHILAAAALLLLEAAMIIGLLYERRRRRNAEIETRQRMSELAHLNRQATAGELSAWIRTRSINRSAQFSITRISASVLLNSPSPDLEEVQAILDEIRRDSQRASEVIRRLRRLLGKSAIEAQNIDLNETVREVFEFLSAQAAARKITLSSRLGSGAAAGER